MHVMILLCLPMPVAAASQKEGLPVAQAAPAHQHKQFAGQETRRKLSLAIMDDNLSAVRSIIRRSRLDLLSPGDNADDVSPFQEAVTGGSKRIIESMMTQLEWTHGLSAAQKAYEQALSIAIRAAGVQRA